MYLKEKSKSQKENLNTQIYTYTQICLESVVFPDASINHKAEFTDTDSFQRSLVSYRSACASDSSWPAIHPGSSVLLLAQSVSSNF